MEQATLSDFKTLPKVIYVYMNYFLMAKPDLVVYYRVIKDNVFSISSYRYPLNLKLNKYEISLSLDITTKTEWETYSLTLTIDQLKYFRTYILVMNCVCYVMYNITHS